MSRGPYISSECLQSLHGDCEIGACQCPCHQDEELEDDDHPTLSDDPDAEEGDDEGEIW